jgi:ketosteroid isomerase-like protein
MSNPTRRTAIATAALALTAPVSLAQAPPKTTAASKPPPEIQSLIDSHIKAFNTQDNKLFFSVFGDTAIIIDGIAPYRWLNPNAPAKWIADVEKWRQDLGVTKEHLSYEMGFWNVEGTSAYAVIVGTLTIMIKDQSIVRAGTLAYTFAKRDGVWKIEAQAWGRTS